MKKATTILIGCALLIGLWVGSLLLQKHYESAERERLLERCRQAVHDAKTTGRPTIFHLQAIPMLASDAECQEKTTSLDFALFEIDEVDLAGVKKLRNLKKMFFYCSYPDDILDAAQGMPSVEELSFELCGDSDRAMDLLKTFPNLQRVSYEQVMPQKKVDFLKKTLPMVEFAEFCTPENEKAARESNGA